MKRDWTTVDEAEKRSCDIRFEKRDVILSVSFSSLRSISFHAKLDEREREVEMSLCQYKFFLFFVFHAVSKLVSSCFPPSDVHLLVSHDDSRLFLPLFFPVPLTASGWAWYVSGCFFFLLEHKSFLFSTEPKMRWSISSAFGLWTSCAAVIGGRSRCCIKCTERRGRRISMKQRREENKIWGDHWILGVNHEEGEERIRRQNNTTRVFFRSLLLKNNNGAWVLLTVLLYFFVVNLIHRLQWPLLKVSESLSCPWFCCQVWSPLMIPFEGSSCLRRPLISLPRNILT